MVMVSSPTIILAIDSAETRLLTKYTNAGQLPFLGRFVKNWRIVEGPHHFCEMGAWTTLWSGVSAAEHGYFCMRRPVPGKYDLEHSSRPVKHCAPFWASMPGRVSIWDAQECYPDPMLAGEQLCNWRTAYAAICPPPPGSSPDGLMAEVEAEYGLKSRPAAIDPVGTATTRREHFQRSKERIATCGRLFREVIGRGGRDLYVLGCAELHSAGHLCWTHDEEGERRILELYQDLDRELESVIRLAPEGSKVLAVSAYGIEVNYPTADVAEQLMRGLGYQQSPVGGGLSSLKGLIPLAVRRKMGEYLPTAAQERIIREGLRTDTDWSKSVAYGLPGIFSASIRINLRGREPEGIVKPGGEYEEVVSRIAEDLGKLESPVPLKIRRIGELTKNLSPQVPDLVISWQERNSPWDRIVHPRFEAPIARHHFHRSTYHTYRGFVGAMDERLLEGVPAVLDIPEVAGVLRRVYAGAGRSLLVEESQYVR